MRTDGGTTPIKREVSVTLPGFSQSEQQLADAFGISAYVYPNDEVRKCPRTGGARTIIDIKSRKKRTAWISRIK